MHTSETKGDSVDKYNDGRKVEDEIRTSFRDTMRLCRDFKEK